MDLLKALLGQTEAEPVPVDPEDEIAIESSRLEQPKNIGLFKKGPFALGNTGANVLGALGDALLGKPVYQNKVDRMNMVDALENYRTDPETAVDKVIAVNPEFGIELQNKRALASEMRAVRDAQVLAARQKYEDNVHGTVTRLMGAATKETWPAMRAQVLRYYQGKGVEPPFDIPEKFDEAAVRQLRLSGVPTKDQYDDEGMAEYRDDQIGVRRESNSIRRSLGESRLEETGRHNRTMEGVASRNADTNRYRAENPARGGKSNPLTNLPKPVYDPKTGKFVIKK